MKLNNKYYLLRHGEAVSNVNRICSSWPEEFENPLTENGVAMIEVSAKKLDGKGVSLIFTSDLLRTKQTAEIVAKTLQLPVNFDTRLREISFGVFNNKSVDEFEKHFENQQERVKAKVPGGENYTEILDRIWNFMEEIDGKYQGKTIVIISHQAPLLLLVGKVKGYSIIESIENIGTIFHEKRITRGELVELN